MRVQYFENVQAEPPREKILYRLGYKKGKTELNEHDAAAIGFGIKMGLSLCETKAAYGIFKIESNDFSRVVLSGGAEFSSPKLADLLKDSDEAVLMASTAGSAVVARRDAEMKRDNASLGIVLDAAASETADDGLNWLENYINTELRRRGKTLTKRFSPGYGDVDLSAQKVIYDLLKPDKIGIEITEKYMLLPEKSVFAIAGIAGGR